MVARASEICFKTNYELEIQEQMDRRKLFYKPKTDPSKMNTLQATAVLKNIENKLEGLQVTVEKNLVNVKPMSDLSNWDTTGYETYLKNPAQELPENIKDKGARTKDEGARTKGVYLKILGATSDQLVTSGLNHADDSGVDGEKYFNSYCHLIDPADTHIQEELCGIMLFAHKGIKTAQDAILGIIQDECDPSGYNLRGRIKGTVALRALKITVRNKIIRVAAELEALVTSLHNRDVRTLEELLKHEQEVILVRYALSLPLAFTMTHRILRRSPPGLLKRSYGD